MERPIYIQKRHLESKEFNPTIYRMGHFGHFKDASVSGYIEKRHLMDYEIEFYTYSNGGMMLDYKYYEIKKNDLCIKKPGQYTRAMMPYTCYFIGVDPSGSGDRVKAYSPYIDNKVGAVPLYQHPLLASLPPIIRPKNPSFYRELFERMMTEYLNPSPFSALVLKQLTLQLLLELNNEVVEKDNVIQSAYRKPINKVIHYMTSHLDEKIRLDDFAELAGMSPSHLHKIFHQEIGITPLAYLLRLRMDRAKKLLVMSEMTMSAIALDCGFETSTYFATSFKRLVGVSPSAYRIEHSRY